MPFVLGDPTQTVSEIHVGDIGTSFVSTIYDQDESLVDLSPAISMTFRFESPASVRVDKTGVLYTDGVDGKVKYIIESGVFSVAGDWKYQVIIVFAGATWNTNIVEFTVFADITAPA